MVEAGDSFPRRFARTLRFTLGAPRNITVLGDGRVAFVRSRSGTDRLGCLWSLDPATGAETLHADPRELLGRDGEDLSAEERARRERAREAAAGVVGYAVDREATVAAFALSSRLFVADLTRSGQQGGARQLPATRPVLDPRPDPTGRQVAYVAGGALRLTAVDAGTERVLAEPDRAGVTWGLAEFVAAEEMERDRGYWWSPDGQRLLVARVDEAAVSRWHIADPEHPDRPPAEVAYPAAGTANAQVTLWLVDLDGTRREVAWDHAVFPYLVTVSWTEHGEPLVQVMDRRQRRAQVLAVDPATGTTRLVAEQRNDTWLDVVPGTPAWTPDGRLALTADSENTRRLLLAGIPVTPPALQVESVLDVDDDAVLVAATGEPTERHLWLVGYDGSLTQLTREPGVHAGRRHGGVLVVASATLAQADPQVRVRAPGGERNLASYALDPALALRVTLLRAGHRELRTAVLLPSWYEPGDPPLPVLMDPYGGPHAQRVVAARRAHLTSQWLADQGFAVVVADGRGTPARGPVWERAIAGRRLPDAVLGDQVDALHAVAEQQESLDVRLDLAKVAIRGWSFGGFLAALAVLRRPDVFAAAVAGAPVTDWTLYDTFYTERYLGLPEEDPGAYAAANLVNDAARLERPLLLIHGLADDNVVAAHSLRLSSALLAAGRPHVFLPLSGVTHMTTREVVAENLLLLQVRFLREALGLAPTPPAHSPHASGNDHVW